MSGIAATLLRTLGEYQAALAAGVSREDCARGFEAVLRDVFPLSKFPPHCGVCDDLGWRDMLCWHEQRCGRKHCHDAHPSEEHAYVVPCECPAGDKHRRRERTPDDAITAAAKVKKPRSFTRFGA